MTIKENMKVPMKNSREVYNVMKVVLADRSEADKSKEFFYILGLNPKNQINYIEVVSMGTMTSSLVHPREVFKVAILKDSASIIAVHNHPSGDTNPSKDDLTTTARLHETGKIIGIPLLDHLIITPTTYLSLNEKGYIA